MTQNAVPGQRDIVPIGRRIGNLADQHPEMTALIRADRDGREDAMSWAALEADSNAAARILARRGVSADSLVVVALPADFSHVVATIGAWKLGAMVLPVEHAAPPRELGILLDTAKPDLVVTDRPLSAVRTVSPAELSTAAASADPLPDPPREPRSAHATGGSTGRPRIIVRRPSWVYPAGDFPSVADRAIGLDVGQVQLLMLPISSGGFTKVHHGLALDHTVVLLSGFVAARAAEVIERHRVSYFPIVPSLMRRLLNAPEFLRADLSSISAVHVGAAGSPVELKRAWLERLAPETLYEGYSSQERIGAVWIRGDEWLEHPGSVGRSASCEIRVFTDDGELARPGAVGEIFMKSAVTAQPAYIGGGPPLAERDGFLSLGDAGFLDEQGYLYVVGRKVEMINVGGVKVYPAEVEEVLLNHPEVSDAVAVGRPHDYLGQAVHVVVVPADPHRPPSSRELHKHCAAQLSMAKVPLSYEIRDEVPRNDAGKLRRSSLVPAVNADGHG